MLLLPVPPPRPINGPAPALPSHHAAGALQARTPLPPRKCCAPLMEAAAAVVQVPSAPGAAAAPVPAVGQQWRCGALAVEVLDRPGRWHVWRGCWWDQEQDRRRWQSSPARARTSAHTHAPRLPAPLRRLLRVLLGPVARHEHLAHARHGWLIPAVQRVLQGARVSSWGVGDVQGALQALRSAASQHCARTHPQVLQQPGALAARHGGCQRLALRCGLAAALGCHCCCCCCSCGCCCCLLPLVAQRLLLLLPLLLVALQPVLLPARALHALHGQPRRPAMLLLLLLLLLLMLLLLLLLLMPLLLMLPLPLPRPPVFAQAQAHLEHRGCQAAQEEVQEQGLRSLLLCVVGETGHPSVKV